MIFSLLLNDLISDFIFKGQYQFSLPGILHCVCLQIQVSVETEVFVFFSFCSMNSIILKSRPFLS